MLDFLDALASLKTMLDIKWLRNSCFQDFKITVLHNITEYYRVSQRAPECYRVLLCVTDCYRLLQSILEYYKVLQRQI